MSKLIFGCGYLGARVAKRWRDAGDEVFAVTRSDKRAAELEQHGLRPIVADVLKRNSLAGLPDVRTVLYAIGYDRGAGVSMHDLYVDGLRSALAALPAGVERFLYVSSTGVYGQTGGDWVDELSPCEPRREGGRACLAAEQVLADHALGSRAVILRMAGLYGPGRLPNLDDLRRGMPIAAPERGWLNLIHVDDAAEVILAAEAIALMSRTYVVSDGHPVERRAYYELLAQLASAPPPVFGPPSPHSGAAERAVSDKRLRATRMRTELRVALRYPSYREGLAAIVADERPR